MNCLVDLCATPGGKQPTKFDLMINLDTAKSLGIGAAAKVRGAISGSRALIAGL